MRAVLAKAKSAKHGGPPVDEEDLRNFRRATEALLERLNPVAAKEYRETLKLLGHRVDNGEKLN